MPRFATTTPRDRTADFTALVERLKKQPGVTTSSDSNANGTIQNRANGGATVQQQSEFARKAALIGRSIHDTSTKLQKLAQLAKRTSMFDDPAVEIDKLTSIIKHDIQGLNAAIADLQKVAASNRECSKQSSFHSTTVVDNLRSRLKDATKEFKDVLTMRTDNLKVHQNRRQMYSASQTGSASNLPAAPLGLGGQGLMLPQASRPKSAHELFGGAPKGSLQGGAGENTPLLSKYAPLPVHHQPPNFLPPAPPPFSQPCEMRRRKGNSVASSPSNDQSGHRYNPAERDCACGSSRYLSTVIPAVSPPAVSSFVSPICKA